MILAPRRVFWSDAHNVHFAYGTNRWIALYGNRHKVAIMIRIASFANGA